MLSTDNFAVFYHVACMGRERDWKAVVSEQVRELSNAGLLPNVRCCVLGRDKDVDWVAERLNVVWSAADLKLYETPTLQKLWEWSHQNPSAAVMYMHTKGVSKPNCILAAAVRHVASEVLIRETASCVELLTTNDVVGLNWTEGFPDHFSGNFWFARCDWINSLLSPEVHKTIPLTHRRTGNDWIDPAWDRMHAEMWVGNFPNQSRKPTTRWVACTHCDWWKIPGMTAMVRGTETLSQCYMRHWHWTDKGTTHTYIGPYAELFEPIRQDAVSLCEIGIDKGGSLGLWSDYFQRQDARIVGVDIYCRDRSFGRIRTIQGDSRIKTTAEKVGAVNVLIDDGSHDVNDQVATFRVFWPNVKPGGIYVIEDVQGDREATRLMQEHPFEDIDLRSHYHDGGFRWDNRLFVARKPA